MIQLPWNVEKNALRATLTESESRCDYLASELRAARDLLATHEKTNRRLSDALTEEKRRVHALEMKGKILETKYLAGESVNGSAGDDPVVKALQSTIAKLSRDLEHERARVHELLETNGRMFEANRDARSVMRRIQTEHKSWADRNFPNADPLMPMLGIVEEVGELAHALLKSWQDIRGTKEKHEAAAKDAVGDIVIFLLDFCSRRGWDLQTIVEETWAHVSKRDWTKKVETTGFVQVEAPPASGVYGAPEVQVTA